MSKKEQKVSSGMAIESSPSTEDIRITEEKRVKDFTEEYYAVCRKHKLQIASALQVITYEEPKTEQKPTSV